jgi:hypothetical protein
MRAAGVRPKPRGVVFFQCPLLEQNLITPHHKHRNGFVPQAALMRL